MPKENSEILAEQRHATRCPSCLSAKVSRAQDGAFVTCEMCGHAWMGSDFAQDEQEATPPTFNGRD